MTLNYDDFEGYGEEGNSMRGSKRGGRTGYMGSGHDVKGKHTEDASSTPMSRISEVLAQFKYDESRDDPNTIEKRKDEKQSYADFIIEALRNGGEELMRKSYLRVDGDLDGIDATVVHKPTKFSANGTGVDHESAVTAATFRVQTQVEKHLKDWRDVSDDFRKFHGITTEQPIN